MSRRKELRAFVVLGPKDEELVYFGDGGLPLRLVQYPYRKTPDLYVVSRGHPVKCCRDGCGDEIPIPKRGPSPTSTRRVVRHFLSHHRRHRTLLPWWDSDPNLVGTQVRLVWKKAASSAHTGTK